MNTKYTNNKYGFGTYTSTTSENNGYAIERVCDQLPTSADNVTLLAFAAERRAAAGRSISPVV